MKKFLLGGVALAAMLVGPAMAADMPVKARPAPPPPPVVYNWTGCFIGASGGGGWHRTDTQRVANGAVAITGDWGKGDGDGRLFGGQVGCDYQTGNFVFGVQFWGAGASIQDRHPQVNGSFAAGAIGTLETRIRSMETLTGRVGYAVLPEWLLYVRGGGAWKRDTISLFQPGGVALSENAGVRFDGITFGGGAEYMLMRNLSVFAEASHADFSRKQFTFVAAPGTLGNPDTVNHKQSVTTVLVGLNLRLNWGR
jgi:outer membrane immunogenic protein